jgi:hypothetical protein
MSVAGTRVEVKKVLGEAVGEAKGRHVILLKCGHLKLVEGYVAARIQKGQERMVCESCTAVAALKSAAQPAAPEAAPATPVRDQMERRAFEEKVSSSLDRLGNILGGLEERLEKLGGRVTDLEETKTAPPPGTSTPQG